MTTTKYTKYTKKSTEIPRESMGRFLQSSAQKSGMMQNLEANSNRVREDGRAV